MNRTLFILTLTLLLRLGYETGHAQEENEPTPPLKQIPVQERDTGDSAAEIMGELPGKIVTLPAKVFFHGLGRAAAVIDYQSIVLRVTDWLTNEDGTRRVRPIFAPFSGGGAVFAQDNLLTQGLDFQASASFGIRTRRNLFVGFQDTQLFGRRLGLMVAASHARLPDEDFFGIGIGSDKDQQTDYLYQENSVNIELVTGMIPNTLVSVGFALSEVDIGDGRDPNFPTLRDSADVFFDRPISGLFGANLGTLLVKFFHDTRNEIGHPTDGGETFLSFEWAREWDAEQLGYGKFTFDLRRYINLFYRRVLALRTKAELTYDIEGREVPFFRLAALGGVDNLRGYRPVRFRDDDMILLGAEYRFPIHHSAVVTAFFEEGRVFRNLVQDFAFDDFKYTVGVGIRLLSKEDLVAVLEFAKSEEQFRFNFALNSSLRRF